MKHDRERLIDRTLLIAVIVGFILILARLVQIAQWHLPQWSHQ
jgi:hypothetical protein